MDLFQFVFGLLLLIFAVITSTSVLVIVVSVLVSVLAPIGLVGFVIWLIKK